MYDLLGGEGGNGTNGSICASPLAALGSNNSPPKIFQRQFRG